MLGMAGGDGSLAAVADVAIEQECRSSASRSGRATTSRATSGSTGTTRSAPSPRSTASERRVDVGRVGERLFLNNVSLGLYARLVHRREHHRRRGTRSPGCALSLLTVRDRRRRQRFTIDGEHVRARLVLVANNDYSLELLSLGERERIDEGLLHLYVPHGFRRITWDERSAPELEIGFAAHPYPGRASTASRSSSTRRCASGSSRRRYACSCRVRQSDRIGT